MQNDKHYTSRHQHYRTDPWDTLKDCRIFIEACVEAFYAIPVPSYTYTYITYRPMKF